MDTFKVTSPLLSLTIDSNTCILCDFIITTNEKKTTMSFTALESLKDIPETSVADKS